MKPRLEVLKGPDAVAGPIGDGSSREGLVIEVEELRADAGLGTEVETLRIDEGLEVKVEALRAGEGWRSEDRVGTGVVVLRVDDGWNKDISGEPSDEMLAVDSLDRDDKDVMGVGTSKLVTMVEEDGSVMADEFVSVVS